MQENELYHYGKLGMKWGRRGRKQFTTESGRNNINGMRRESQLKLRDVDKTILRDRAAVRTYATGLIAGTVVTTLGSALGAATVQPHIIAGSVWAGQAIMTGSTIKAAANYISTGKEYTKIGMQ